jgi:hypothetical protein
MRLPLSPWQRRSAAARRHRALSRCGSSAEWDHGDVGFSAAAAVTAAAALCGMALAGPAPGRLLTDSTETCGPGSGPVDVRISPRRGPVGTRVRISGRCFPRRWNSGYGIFLLRQFTKPRECELIAGGRFRFRVNHAGVGRGWFKVARDGACFQHRYRRRVTPGRYWVGFGCHTCSIGRFRVTR